MVDANIHFRAIGLQTTECRRNEGFGTLRIYEGILSPRWSSG